MMTAPYWSNGVATLYQADAREIPLPDGSVHCVVTSPPYHGLRDYGLGIWEGGDANCEHKTLKDLRNTENLRRSATIDAAGGHLNVGGSAQPFANRDCRLCGARQQAAGIGLEPTLSDWLANIVAVSQEVWRVLRDDGTYWLNLGDAYSGSGKGPANAAIQTTNPAAAIGRHRRVDRGPSALAAGGWTANVDGLPAKNLMGQPWRAAFALQDDGWILRSAITWVKPNPMPESVGDRPTSAYEMVFLLTKRARYFYDAEAVRETAATNNWPGIGPKHINIRHRGEQYQDMQSHAGRNARNVWTIPTQGRPEAHFATFPDELPRRCILAGTSEHGVCADCGAPWVRQADKELIGGHPIRETERQKQGGKLDHGSNRAKRHHAGGVNATRTLGWQPACDHNAARIPATVLDPFVGSGTTVAVAQQLGRHGIGLDLNPDYLAIAAKRLTGIALPLAL